MKRGSLILCSALYAGLSGLAYAQTSPAENAAADAVAPQPEMQVQAPVQDAASPVLPKPHIGLQVPRLAIRWDCKEECTVNEKVAPLIEKGYADAAMKQGYAVSDSETAEMVITDYRQRPPGVRVMFGFLAGRDRLGVRIVYHAQERKAEDYYANSWLGMNSLCESVAQKSYSEIVTIVKAEQAKPAAAN
ncbi:hypothetical protein [Collimonas humicola]|uniref:hypothetical protein n=1 Tax=Collimonas humicola TaxID=2825886 RepID=UPI001B8CFF7A|nr:hypothetical protein [Collimonas humicola]